MKKYIYLLFTLLLLSSCSAPKLTNTVWCTINGATNGEQEGLIIESLYFMEDGELNIVRSIATDNGLEVSPYKHAGGNYETFGSLKKDASISISASTLKGDSLNLNGLINVKKNTLLLYNSSDSTATTYFKNPNVFIKEY